MTLDSVFVIAPVTPLIAWYWWLYLAIFIAVVAIAGLWAAFMDRRRGREIENDPERPHPHGEGDLHGPRE